GRSLPRGAEAGRTLRAVGGPARRAALLDRRPDRRAGKPLRILRAAVAAVSAGAAVMRVRAALFVLTLGLALSCAAQTYPSRAIRIVVAFPAGGGSDLAARVVGQKLSEGFGQPVVVENRIGANGSVGAEAVARSAPDGYTLVMGSNANITTNPHLMALSYDPMRDLAPVAMLTVNPLLLFVNPAVVPVASRREAARHRHDRRAALGVRAGDPHDRRVRLAGFRRGNLECAVRAGRDARRGAREAARRDRPHSRAARGERPAVQSGRRGAAHER